MIYKIVHAQLLSCVRIFVTPWTVAHQVLLCMEFLSQEYWSGCYFLLQSIEYYSAIKKNTLESVLMRWMKLEPIIQSEVSQKEKYQYIILMHIYGI